MKNFKALKTIIAATLAGAILLGFSSCSNTSWTHKAGDDSISAGVYLGYLIDAYYTAANSVSDTSADLFSQKIDDLTAEAYIKKTAKEAVLRQIAIDRLFEEYKLSFTDKELEEFESSISSTWDSVSSLYESNGCGKVSFTEIMKTEEKYKKVFEYYYSKDGKEPLSESDRKDYFLENFAKIKYVAVNYSSHFSGVSTADKATDAQKAELKKIADGYVIRLNNGEDIAKISAAESLAAHELEVADEENHDHDHSNYGEDTEVDFTFLTKDTAKEPDAFNKTVFASKYNSAVLTENSTYGYYVFIRYELDESSSDYTEREYSVLSSMKSTAFDEILSKESAKITVDENSAAIKRFKPQNIEFNF